MQAALIRRYGKDAPVELAEIERPEADRDQLLVKVRATAVNPVDWKIRDGLGELFGLKLPLILGCEVAGIVETAGENVKEFAPGDEVYGYLAAHSGGYAEYVAASAAEFVRKPNDVDFDTAASVPVAALTAWQGVFDGAHLQKGQRILITGASGAVGSLAVQLAKRAGADVIGLGSGANEEFVRGLGADEFVDYKTTKFEEQVSAVDVVFDAVGGDTQERAFQVLKRSGVLISTVSPPSPEKAQAHGVTVSMVVMMPNPDQLAQINNLLATGTMKARVAKVLPLAQVQEALRLSETGRANGKIILRPE
jgi:NADPH:quinone reductase-like Zn-dependent oxidoreductase